MDTHGPYTLRRSDLISKWGFGDGDMFDDLLWDTYESVPESPDPTLCFEHEVLWRCVDRYLISTLERPVTLQRFCTAHNPARLFDEEYDAFEADLMSGPDVTVTAEQVLAVAAEVKAEWATQ